MSAHICFRPSLSKPKHVVIDVIVERPFPFACMCESHCAGVAGLAVVGFGGMAAASCGLGGYVDRSRGGVEGIHSERVERKGSIQATEIEGSRR